jgi:hypothetical protein
VNCGGLCLNSFFGEDDRRGKERGKNASQSLRCEIGGLGLGEYRRDERRNEGRSVKR